MFIMRKKTADQKQYTPHPTHNYSYPTIHTLSNLIPVFVKSLNWTFVLGLDLFPRSSLLIAEKHKWSGSEIPRQKWNLCEWRPIRLTTINRVYMTKRARCWSRRLPWAKSWELEKRPCGKRKLKSVRKGWLDSLSSSMSRLVVLTEPRSNDLLFGNSMNWACALVNWHSFQKSIFWLPSGSM